LRVFLYLFHA